MNIDTSILAQVGSEAVLAAGELLRQGFGTTYKIEAKELKNDIVTEYDHASEQLIVNHLRNSFPLHTYLCEESGRIGTDENSTRWILDPLDGTINFAHGIPLFTISLAAVFKNEILCGIIYQPMTNELFIAEKGKGAYLNGKQLNVSDLKDIDKALISTSLSFNLHKDQDYSLQVFNAIAAMEIPQRALGSTALNLAYVAAGRFDCYWSTSGSVNAWDMAAGQLLVEEAGGKLTRADGKPFQLDKPSSLLATNKHLHDPILQILFQNNPL